MNSNYNQQSNYQRSNQFNQTFGNQIQPNFNQPDNFVDEQNYFQNNSSTSRPFESFSQTFDSLCPQATCSSSRFSQLNSGSDQFKSMGENMFNQSSSSITPTNSPSFQVTDFGEANCVSDDLVQNYGPRDSDEYREKRNRNNMAVRKARKKFQKKNQEVQERLVDLKKKNNELIHEREKAQRAHDELRDLHDRIFCNY